MKQIAKWEIVELELTSDKEFINPFIDVSVLAIFYQDANAFEVDGFYDGYENDRHVWRVRFAPMCQGQWYYKIISNIDELNGRTGKFECAEPVSRGGLTINPHFPNWFSREDGSFQMIINEGWYPHPANVGQLSYEEVDFPQPSEEDMKTYLKILGDYKVNMVIDIAQLYARQSTITDTSFRWPWKVVDAERNKIDKDYFNLDYYQRMDRVMKYAKQKNIFFGMELLYDNSVVRPREWSMHPLNKANGGWLEGNEHGTGWDVMFDLDNEEHIEYTSRYLRYTIARFAAYWNIFWSIGSENGNLARLPQDRLPHALLPAEKVAKWYNYWGDLIARRDPYGRLRTFGDAGKQPLMVCTAHNNIIITQDPRNYPKDDVKDYLKAMNAFGEGFWNYGRPTIIGEMTATTTGQYETERKLYWIGFTSGYFMGRADRHFGLIEDEKLVESQKFNNGEIPPIYKDLKRMAEFIQLHDIRFWRMKPNDELIKIEEDLIYCLAAEDEEYLLYFVNGGTAELSLPDSNYKWFNPRSGDIFEKGCIERGCVKFEAPDCKDWVLHIVAKKNFGI